MTCKEVGLRGDGHQCSVIGEKKYVLDGETRAPGGGVYYTDEVPNWNSQFIVIATYVISYVNNRYIGN